MLSITNHKLDIASQVPSPNHSGVIDPKFIVMHYTAGWTLQSAVATFSNPSSDVSAHLTIGRDAKVVQHVPFNVKAWHAGKSEYKGYYGLNNHSIGIELVNIGYLRKIGDGVYENAYGKRCTEADVGEVVADPEPRVGSGMFYWPTYTEAQLEMVDRIVKALVDRYHTQDIVTHEEIDLRGWKTDPGPAFPMNRYKAMLGERSDDGDVWEVTASALNVRSGPGTNFGRIDTVYKGTVVNEYGQRGDWVRISDDGWVHGAYLRLA